MNLDGFTNVFLSTFEKLSWPFYRTLVGLFCSKLVGIVVEYVDRDFVRFRICHLNWIYNVENIIKACCGAGFRKGSLEKLKIRVKPVATLHIIQMTTFSVFSESDHFNLLVATEQEYIYGAYGLSRLFNYR